MSNRAIRVSLLALDLVVGVSTIVGAVWVVPTLPTTWLTFFPDYTLPAIGLGAVGVLALAAAAGLGLRPQVGAELSIIAGTAMAVFEVVEAVTAGNLLAPPAGTGGGGPLWLQPFYFVVGATMVALGTALWARTAPGETWTLRLRHPLGTA